MDFLRAIWDKVSGLYLPTPEAALRERAHIPVGDPRNERSSTVPAPAPPALRIWHSRTLDTKGLTLQNGWVRLRVVADTAAAEGLTLNALLLGSFNSPLAELARTAVVYTGLGDYTFPVLTNPDSLATDVSLAIEALGDDNPRQLTFFATGYLAAGYRF